MRRILDPNFSLRLGLIFLILGNVATYVVRREHFTHPLADGLAGLVMGIAIGLLLLAIWTRTRRLSRGC